MCVYNKEYNYGTAYDTETLQTGSHESVAVTQWQPAALWSPVVMYKEFVVATVNLIGCMVQVIMCMCCERMP